MNGRPVKDKLIAGAIRGAYADVMPRGRFPAVVLYLNCAADRVDVNVHPAKTEVRFRDPGFVRGLIVSAIRRALAGQAMKPDTMAGRATTQAFHAQGASPSWRSQWNPSAMPATNHFAERNQTALAMNMPLQSEVREVDEHLETLNPLGCGPDAIAWQLHRGANRKWHGAGRPARGPRTHHLRTSEA